MTRQSIYLLTTLLLVTVQPVDAAEWWFTPGGVSDHHTSEPGKNENNFGMGLLYEWSDSPDTKRYYTGGYYRNSQDGDTLYGGYGIKHTVISHGDWYVDFGAVAGVLTGYEAASIIPVVLPTLTIGNNSAAVNIQYVPSVNDMNAETVTFNLLIRLP